jgi:hypothetical protein
VSSPREFQPEALSKSGSNLSVHPVPIIYSAAGYTPFTSVNARDFRMKLMPPLISNIQKRHIQKV